MSSVKHMAVLNALHLNGPQDYLALERILGMAGLHRLTNYMQQQNLIAGLPKKAGELRKYKLTQEGLSRIGQMAITTKRVYEPLVYKEFTPTRPGAMDAISIKSKGVRC
jgi:hypothetical protein